MDEDNNPLTVDEDDRTEHYEKYHGKSRIGRLMASYALLFVTCCVPVSTLPVSPQIKVIFDFKAAFDSLMSCSD